MFEETSYTKYVAALSTSLTDLSGEETKQCMTLIERAFEMHRLLQQAWYQINTATINCGNEHDKCCCYCEIEPACEMRNMLRKIEAITDLSKETQNEH